MHYITKLLAEARANFYANLIRNRDYVLNEMAAVPGTKTDINGDEKLMVQIGNLKGSGGFEDRFVRAIKDPNSPMHPSKYRHNRTGEQIAESSDILSEKKKEESDVTDKDQYVRTGLAQARALDTLVKKHKRVKKLVSTNKFHFERSGGSGGKVQDSYAKLGGKNATSRADVVLKSHDGKQTERVSLKQGASQLASAEGGEFRALAHHAVDSYTKHEPTRKKLKAKIDEMSKIQKSARDAKNPEQHKKNLTRLNRHWNDIRSEHPELEHHIAHEAATGHHKFGKGGEGSADHLVSYDPKSGSHKVWSADSGEKLPVKKMEFRMGKGKTGSRANPEKRRQRDYAFRIDM